MKIKIDTENKTVLIEQDINLSELIKFMKKHFKDDWKDYNIISMTYPIPYYPDYPITIYNT